MEPSSSFKCFTLSVCLVVGVNRNVGHRPVDRHVCAVSPQSVEHLLRRFVVAMETIIQCLEWFTKYIYSLSPDDQSCA